MNKYLQCSFICVIFISVIAAEDLQCYQCNPVTAECEDNKADVINCGDMLMSRCSRQVKKGSTDKTKALRKCVMTDNLGNVNCPVDYECFNCATNLCNANPIVVSTTHVPDSATIAKCAWFAVIGGIFVFIYL